MRRSGRWKRRSKRKSTSSTAPRLKKPEDEDAEVKLPDFKKIDDAVKDSDGALDKVVDVLHDLAVDDPAEALADLTLFDTEYDRLLQTWDRFHSNYNAWRADDGGCDRLEVLESLTEFSANVDAVGDSVRSLPKSGYLEPVHRLAGGSHRKRGTSLPEPARHLAALHSRRPAGRGPGAHHERYPPQRRGHHHC